MADIFGDKEKSTYQIKNFKNIQRIDEVGIIATSLTKLADKFEINNESEVFPQKVKETTIVKIDSTNLRPINYESRICTPSGEITIIGEYQKNKVEVRAALPQETKNIKIDLSNNYYDNATIFYVLRAFALGVFEDKKFYLVNLNIGQKVLVELELTGEEGVKTGIGEFYCLGVKMMFCDHPNVPSQKFLYNKNKPHYLIRNTAGPQIIEIIEIKEINY